MSVNMQISKNIHDVIVVGGGVAGLELATTLARRKKVNVRVTLVDRGSTHIWKPMLHKVAAGTSNASQQQTTYLAQARSAGFTFQPGALCGLDRKSHEVEIAPIHASDGRLLVPARLLKYGTLILAIGSEANDFDTPGVAEHCFRIDSRSQADAFNEELRIRLLQCITQNDKLAVGIVGGGATGVELAAELLLLAEAATAYGARELPSRISITLIESGPRLLAAFPEDISQFTRSKLEALGVRVLTGVRVSGAATGGFRLHNGGNVPASLKVWAAGVKAPAVLRGLDGLETNNAGQLIISSSLQTTIDPDIYAIGDCASLTSSAGQRPLPPTAQVAHQEAQHLARYLGRAIEAGGKVPDFRYRNFGSIVSLGEYDAFASLGQFGFFKGMSLRGKLAQLSHVMLYRSHQARLHGFGRGSMLWIMDRLDSVLRSSIKLD